MGNMFNFAPELDDDAHKFNHPLQNVARKGKLDTSADQTNKMQRMQNDSHQQDLIDVRSSREVLAVHVVQKLHQDLFKQQTSQNRGLLRALG